MAPAVAVVTQATTTNISSEKTIADALYAGLPDKSASTDSTSGSAHSSSGSSGRASHQSTAVEQPAQLRSTALDFPASLQPASLQPASQPTHSEMPGVNGP